MPFPANHYQILGVDIQADDAAIKKAYKKLALENHPDKTLHLSAALVERRTKIFKLATTAYEILLDPVQRAKHDKTLAQSVRPSYTKTEQPFHRPGTGGTGPFQHQYQQRPNPPKVPSFRCTPAKYLSTTTPKKTPLHIWHSPRTYRHHTISLVLCARLGKSHSHEPFLLKPRWLALQDRSVQKVQMDTSACFAPPECRHRRRHHGKNIRTT